MKRVKKPTLHDYPDWEDHTQWYPIFKFWDEEDGLFMSVTSINRRMVNSKLAPFFNNTSTRWYELTKSEWNNKLKEHGYPFKSLLKND